MTNSSSHTVSHRCALLALLAVSISCESPLPLRGSLAWAQCLTTPKNGNRVSNINPESARRIFSEFKRQAPTTTNYHWNSWCQVIHCLAELKQWDDAVVPVVQARFLDTDLDQHCAGWVLRHYRRPETEELFRQRLRIVLKNCSRPKEGIKINPSETWNLLHFMELKEEASLNLLRKALTHPHDTVRSCAYGSGEALPAAEARHAARHAIETETVDHNLTMAAYLIRDTGTINDVPWLTAARRRFKTKELQEKWQRAVTEIKERAAKQP